MLKELRIVGPFRHKFRLGKMALPGFLWLLIDKQGRGGHGGQRIEAVREDPHHEPHRLWNERRAYSSRLQVQAWSLSLQSLGLRLAEPGLPA
jgi:hypothetical protein